MCVCVCVCVRACVCVCVRVCDAMYIWLSIYLLLKLKIIDFICTAIAVMHVLCIDMHVFKSGLFRNCINLALCCDSLSPGWV